jgi:hypothetical protein
MRLKELIESCKLINGLYEKRFNLGLFVLLKFVYLKIKNNLSINLKNTSTNTQITFAKDIIKRV